MNFFAELKRRNVYKVAIAYIVGGWALAQGIAQVLPVFDISNWAIRVIVLLIILGLPVAIALAWMFEITPEGIKRTKIADAANERSRGRTWIYVVVIGAIASIGLFLLGRYSAQVRQKSSSDVSAKSIAVLPFESLSEDKSNAYFADGIQDQILARLSKIADLKVISRTSTQKYKSAPDNLREIAQQLGVTNILEGSVQKAADQVRITVQLLNALKDEHLWAETYDRKMTDIFSVETDVAQKIATALEAKLTGREKSEIAFVGTRVPEAYDALLHALALRGSQRLDALQKQRDFLRRAVELDQNYPQAWAYLGATEALIYFFPDPTEARKDQARAAVEKALQLAPELAEAHAAIGIYKYYCLRDYEGALTELKIARNHAPNDGTIAFFTALVQRRQGKFEDAITGMQQAAILDPLNEDIPVNLGSTYRGMRRFDEARAMFDRALTISLNDPQILARKAETFLAEGNIDEAERIISGLKFSISESGFGTYVQVLLARHQFDKMIEAFTSALNTSKDLPPLFRVVVAAALADTYMAKGDRSAALPFRTQADEGRKAMSTNEHLPPLFNAVFIQMEASFGDRDAVERDIRELLALTEKDKWEFPNSEATAARGYTVLGEFDRALPLLQDALARPSEQSVTTSYLQLDPVWDKIRGDPRFQKLAAPSP